MAQQFPGPWPDTPSDGPSSIWLDDATGDLIIQSWKAVESTGGEHNADPARGQVRGKCDESPRF